MKASSHQLETRVLGRDQSVRPGVASAAAIGPAASGIPSSGATPDVAAGVADLASTLGERLRSLVGSQHSEAAKSR